MTEQSVYLKQIARLQEQNRLLAEVIADERRLRQAAWKEYWHRCQSSFWRILNIFLLIHSEEKARSDFYTDSGQWLRRSA